MRYVVSARIGPSAGTGDHSLEVDATETAPNGPAFTTQTTFGDVGDALLVATETGPAGAPRLASPHRDHRRAAGY